MKYLIHIRKLLFFAIVFVPFMGLSAQQAGTMHLDIELGAGLPIGKFGDDDVDNDDSGLASTGPTGGLTFKYSLEDNFGLLGRYTFNIHTIDSEVVDDLSNDLSVAYPGIDWEVATRGWIVNGVIVGPYFSRNSEKVLLSIGGGIGLIIASSPHVKITGNDGIDELVVSDASATSPGFGYSVSGTIGYMISPTTTIYAGVSFLGGEVDFDFETVIKFNGQEIDSTDESFTQTISLVNIPVGVSFSF